MYYIEIIRDELNTFGQGIKLLKDKFGNVQEFQNKSEAYQTVKALKKYEKSLKIKYNLVKDSINEN